MLIVYDAALPATGNAFPWAWGRFDNLHWQHDMPFAPSKPWEVQIYGIGYVLEKEFLLPVTLKIWQTAHTCLVPVEGCA